MTTAGSRTLSAILGSVLLAGCAATSRWEIPTSCSTTALLGEYAASERLSPDQLDAAFAQAKGAFERSGNDCDRLRVALLTVLQGSRRNETYALKILGEYTDSKGDIGDARTSLARLIGRVLRDRADADARAKAALKKAAEDQNRADACKRQLDELRNVEKIIDERGTR